MENLTSGNEPQEELEIRSSKKQISLNSLLRILLLFVFAGIFSFSFYKIAAKLYAYHKEDKIYNDIRASIQTHYVLHDFQYSAPYSPEVEEERASKEEENTETLPYIVLNGNPEELNTDGIFNIYSDLKAKNSDLVGWISIPGFKKAIDYPVMQYFDNEYYMTHDFYKNKSNSGSIFMDSANLNSEPDKHIIIYGHAMRNNSMFGNLRGYPTDKEKYENITTIYLDLLSTRLEYKVFSAYSTDVSFNYRRTVFSDDADYLSFLNTIKNKSEYDFGIPLSSRDKIITLSTCDKSRGDDGRIAIHAKLVKQIVYDDSGNKVEYAQTEEKGDKKIITSNVYLEKLQLQYQILIPEENEPAEQPVPETSPVPDVSLAPDNTPVPDASPAPDNTPEPDTSPVPKTSQVASPDNTGEAKKSLEGDWHNMILDPPFSTANALFSAKLPAQAAFARITVKPYDENARISFTINDKKADPERMELVEGENVIIVHVLSADGLYARKYTIKVLRDPPPATPTPQPEQTPEPSEEPAADGD